MLSSAVDPLEGAGVPAAAPEEPHAEIGARPAEVERVEGPFGEPSGRTSQLRDPGAPRRRGIRLVEPRDVGELPPQPLEGLGGLERRMDLLRPPHRSATRRCTSSSFGP